MQLLNSFHSRDFSSRANWTMEEHLSQTLISIAVRMKQMEGFIGRRTAVGRQHPDEPPTSEAGRMKSSFLDRGASRKEQARGEPDHDKPLPRHFRIPDD